MLYRKMNYWMYLLILKIYAHKSSVNVDNLLHSITFVFCFEYIKIVIVADQNTLSVACLELSIRQDDHHDNKLMAGDVIGERSPAETGWPSSSPKLLSLLQSFTEILLMMNILTINLLMENLLMANPVNLVGIKGCLGEVWGEFWEFWVWNFRSAGWAFHRTWTAFPPSSPCRLDAYWYADWWSLSLSSPPQPPVHSIFLFSFFFPHKVVKQCKAYFSFFWNFIV